MTNTRGTLVAVPGWLNLAALTTAEEIAERRALAARGHELLPLVTAWVRDAAPLAEWPDIELEGPAQDLILTAMGIAELDELVPPARSPRPSVRPAAIRRRPPARGHRSRVQRLMSATAEALAERHGSDATAVAAGRPRKGSRARQLQDDTDWQLLAAWCRSIRARNLSKATIQSYHQTGSQFTIWCHDNKLTLDAVGYRELAALRARGRGARC